MNTILLDGDVLLHQACSVSTVSVTFDDTSHWEVDQKAARAWFKARLAAYRKRLNAQRVVIALGDRKANFRKELAPSYKAHRVGPKPPGFLELEASVEKACEVVRAPRLEGDDLLGLLATKEPTAGKIIVTIDKDLAQIPGMLYNPDTDVLREVLPAEGRRLHALQTLTGDRTDGYPGCPGIGPKRAAALLDALEEPEDVWPAIVAAYEKAGQTEADALLQARLAFVLRQGYFNRQTNEVKLWTP